MDAAARYRTSDGNLLAVVPHAACAVHGSHMLLRAASLFNRATRWLPPSRKPALPRPVFACSRRWIFHPTRIWTGPGAAPVPPAQSRCLPQIKRETI
jgi:hypothetical protein